MVRRTVLLLPFLSGTTVSGRVADDVQEESLCDAVECCIACCDELEGDNSLNSTASCVESCENPGTSCEDVHCEVAHSFLNTEETTVQFEENFLCCTNLGLNVAATKEGFQNEICLSKGENDLARPIGLVFAVGALLLLGMVGTKCIFCLAEKEDKRLERGNYTHFEPDQPPPSNLESEKEEKAPGPIVVTEDVKEAEI